MNCSNCGVELEMYALSDKPDPGYGYRSHSWETCARNLLSAAKKIAPQELSDRISWVLAASDKRIDLINEAVRILKRAAGHNT